MAAAGDSLGEEQQPSNNSSSHFVVNFDEIKSPEFLEVFLNYSHGHSPQYSKVSEAIRRLSSNNHKAQSLQCTAFCGGKHCKYENPSRWLNEEGVAFKGLFSHWVTDKLLAMARPSTQLLTEHNLIQQFTECGINAVVNLQTPGEHSHCGPSLETSGFTYQPEELMKNGIYFYNYPWPDYGAPEVSAILDVVEVIDFSCSSGKVAVHCHAGLGRTGVVLACYLLYSLRLTTQEVITMVRTKRPGSIQTRGQLELVERFSGYLRSLWRVYPPQTTFSSVNITEYLQRQSRLLHGEEGKKYRHIPKVIDVICERLRALGRDGEFRFRCELQTEEARETIERIKGHEDQTELQISDDSGMRGGACCHDSSHVLQSLVMGSDCCHSDSVKVAVHNIEDEINSKWNWSLLAEESDPTVLFLLLFNYFIRLSEPLLSSSDEDFWPSLQKYQKAVLTLIMDSIKSILSEADINKNVGSISNHLASIFLEGRSLLSQDSTSRTSVLNYTSTKAGLQEYLLGIPPPK